MRRLLPLAAVLAFSSAAFAQSPPPDAGPPPAPPSQMAPHQHLPLGQRFDAANTTHDGKLTIQQAQEAGWKGVVRNFETIDHDKKGYVTKQDLHQWMAARRAAKAAAQAHGAAAGPPPDNGPPPGAQPPPGDQPPPGYAPPPGAPPQ